MAGGTPQPLFEIVNPSDPYTLRAISADYAAAAVLLLGNGMYGVTTQDGETVLPILGFSDPKEAEAYINERFPKPWIAKNLQLIAYTLDSVVIGSFRERLLYERMLRVLSGTEGLRFMDEWRDARRSSMNDIGARARELARELRKGPPPQPTDRLITP